VARVFVLAATVVSLMSTSGLVRASTEEDLGAVVDVTGVDGSSQAEESADAEPDLTVEDRRVQLPARPGSVWSRVACIEAKESGGANVWNRHGSGAGGVMQYMPGTFARSARELGHPEWSLWVPWQAREVAAHDLMMGRRAQWTVSGC
jgi:hypothetical protein